MSSTTRPNRAEDDDSLLGDRGSAFALRTLLFSSPDAIVLCASSGRIVTANDQCCEIFGYTENQLAGQPVELLLPNRFREAHVEQRQSYMQDPVTRSMGERREVQGLRFDGREIPVEIRLRMIESSIARMSRTLDVLSKNPTSPKKLPAPIKATTIFVSCSV